MALFKRKKRYSKIPYEKRLKLIELVEEEKLFIYQAAQRLRIKLPTAKVILQNYRKTGKIFQKRAQDREEQSQVEEIESRTEQEHDEEFKVQENKNQEAPKNLLPFYFILPSPAFWFM